MKIWLYFLCLLCNLQALSCAVASQQLIQNIVTDEITGMAKKYGIPGVTVALYVQGKPYIFNYGEADMLKHTPVTDQTIFEIGSISKLFTAIIFAQEVIEGHMKFDDPITHYIPSLKTNRHLAKVTLLQLATHTNKLPFDPPDSFTSERQLLEYLQTWKCTSPASECWGYSNHGVELLRIALEKETGLSINELFEQRILKPLNMHEIGCSLNTIDPKKYASCYGKNGKKTIYWNHPYMIGTAALRATSKDMLSFLKAMLGLAKIPAPLQEAILLTQTPFFVIDETLSQGLIWNIFDDDTSKNKSTLPGPRVDFKNNYREVYFQSPAQKVPTKEQVFNPNLLLDKSGTTNGFHAYIAILPSKKSGIVIMANRRMQDGWQKLQNVGRTILLQLKGAE